MYKMSMLVINDDYVVMRMAIDKGIDAHLEAFTKSKFKVGMDDWGMFTRLYCKIHPDEMHILLRRLQEIEDDMRDAIEQGEEDEMTYSVEDAARGLRLAIQDTLGIEGV